MREEAGLDADDVRGALRFIRMREEAGA